MRQTNLSKNAHLAFIQLSSPEELMGGCYAEAHERAIILGVRRTVHQEKIRNALLEAADVSGVSQESCHGSNIAAIFKAVLPNDPEVLKGFLSRLEALGVLEADEKRFVIKDLGVLLPRSTAREVALGVGGSAI